MKQAIFLLPLLINSINNRTRPVSQQINWDSEDYQTFTFLRTSANITYTMGDVKIYDGDLWQANIIYKEFSIVETYEDLITNAIQINIMQWSYDFPLEYITEIDTSCDPVLSGTIKKETAFLEYQPFDNYVNLSNFDMNTIRDILNDYNDEDKFLQTEEYIINTNYSITEQMYNQNEADRYVMNYDTYIEIYTLQSQGTRRRNVEDQLFMGIWNQGFIGYEKVEIPEKIEVIDLSQLLMDILMMPWAFLSVAFNFTLWPGTPYSINLSHLATVFLGTLVLIFVIKLLLKYIK